MTYLMILLVMVLGIGLAAWQHRPPKGSRLGWKIGCWILAWGFWTFAFPPVIVDLVPHQVATPITIGVSDVDLDAEGNIYVATINGRVQVFEPSGAFRFAVRAGSDHVTIEVLDDGFRLLGRFSRVYRFDRDGNPLETRPEDMEMERVDFSMFGVRQEQINGLTVRAGRLNQIAVFDEGGRPLSRIFPNFILVPFFLNPFFGWFMVLLGAIILFVDSPLERRRRWWQ